MSLSLTMSTTVGIARRVTDHERLPRFDAPALLECISLKADPRIFLFAPFRRLCRCLQQSVGDDDQRRET